MLEQDLPTPQVSVITSTRASIRAFFNAAARPSLLSGLHPPTAGLRTSLRTLPKLRLSRGIWRTFSRRFRHEPRGSSDQPQLASAALLCRGPCKYVYLYAPLSIHLNLTGYHVIPTVLVTRCDVLLRCLRPNISPLPRRSPPAVSSVASLQLTCAIRTGRIRSLRASNT